MSRLRDAFAFHAHACAILGSPFMVQLCNLFATRLHPGTPFTDRLFDWPGDVGPRGQSVPLRLCGALHALRLSGDPTLAEVYPPHDASDDALWDAVAQTLTNHAEAIDRFIDSPPQTNEVRRASALIAAAHVIAAHHDLPLELSELGASAGLNLNFDRFALRIGAHFFGPEDAALTLTPTWNGPLPPATRPRIASRRGVDLNPLDPQRDALRLRAYLWPDQPERLALTEAALALPPPPVDRADAIDWLEPRLAPSPGHCRMIYTTVAWQYFPAAKQGEGLSLIEAAGRAATAQSPLAFVQMEDDGGARGAALTLRLWPGDLRLDLGRVDFHGRWIDWSA
ncbi:DUF2332 domain-containing protein [Gymnodinialimonas ceratoperidinii]|uniref:DUF2332 family protein n=1 Tax=Gymnodinialimonas ceratoperidinii TaxID=2856823 RepID=A0A8F6TZ53_9RHOB|nr:DUF2332 family protein [Gymnodinialimonas ceratoperidinii]QXT40608.1 DUF2332 family protein [Gymnodinialimonas ceratoperidinii]